MESTEQKERLEQELRFLKESLDAGVISQEEFQRGNQRIADQLQQLENAAKGASEDEAGKAASGDGEEEVVPIAKVSDEEAEATAQDSDEVQISIKEGEPDGGSAFKGKGVAGDTLEDQKSSLASGKAVESEVDVFISDEKAVKVSEILGDAPKSEESTISTSDVDDSSKEDARVKKGLKDKVREDVSSDLSGPVASSGTAWMRRILAVIILVGILWFLWPASDLSMEVPPEESEVLLVQEPACTGDGDCVESGSKGTCEGAGTEDATCTFGRDVEVQLLVINDAACGVCDSGRMQAVIKELFPNSFVTEIDILDSEAQDLIKRHRITALPAFVFGNTVSEAANFEGFRRALSESEGSFVLSNKASGATYYFKRPLKEGRFDVYVTSNIEERVLANVQPVLELFGEDITFEQHVVTDVSSNVELQSLAITSYPTFLVNNQIKFSGILSPNTLKGKICAFNELDECSAALTKNIA